jgi:peptidyl-dipeptidase Dcp
MKKLFTLLAVPIIAYSCNMQNTEKKDTAKNPLVENWTGPYGGVPAFDKVKIEDFGPALDNAMDSYKKEIDTIAANPEAPNFENTIAAMERIGKPLNNVMTYYYIWSSNMSNDEFQKIEETYSPKLAELGDYAKLNGKLFERIQAVYESEEYKKLNPEQQRLVWNYHKDYVRYGAKLDAQSKERLAAINQELATLFTKFAQNVLADESNEFITVTKQEELAGLPEDMIEAAKEYAQEKGVKDGWAFANTRSVVDPLLTFADNRYLREKTWRMFKLRGDNGNATDNNANMNQILKLRAERAKLLGFETHAHFMLNDKMAKTPENAMELMNAMWKPASERVNAEVVDMQALAKKEGQNITIEPWDYLYYSEKVRKDKYDMDQNQIKPYFQLDKLREAMFWVAEDLFGFQFVQINNVPVYHPDVTVWEVKDKNTGKAIGLFYFDTYARTGKRSGAWMSNYRGQYKLDGEVLPIVSNNNNFIKGKAGEPTLLSFDDATTLFHEFGHALHGLASNVTYPSLQSPNVASDFVEFPSQLMEHWVTTTEVLNKYAVHYKTGEPIPAELVEKLLKSKTFNQGYETMSYLTAAVMDMKLHLEGDKDLDLKAYEKETFDKLGLPSTIVMRHRLPQFLHIFSDDGYSAGYYSYMWAEVISSDAYRAFTEAGGAYDKNVASSYHKNIISIGNTIDPAEAYRNFRGRDPQIDGLMEDRGFATSKK